ncbi:acetyltransferase [Rhizobium sp. BK418]|uniref:acetyltransferase n=1 Tax=Rhizobium sp. BK418 TaxID=2512120 RepID=UPI001FE0BE7A|nr:acetyltransferase [Rhizobium sp. BK418]
MKKDIPAHKGAGYRSPKQEVRSAAEPKISNRNIVETRKGTKTNRAGLGKGNAIPRTVLHSPP